MTQNRDEYCYPLYLHDDRQNHGPALQALVDELLEAAPYPGGDQGPVALGLGDHHQERVHDNVLHLGHELLGRVLENEAPGHDVRSGQDLARGLLDPEDHDHDAVVGELHPVPEDHCVHAGVGSGTLGLPVDVDPAHVHEPRAAGAGFRELHHHAVLDDEDVLLRNIDLLRELGVVHEVAVLAVHGNEVFRLDQGEHELQLFLGRMARDVDLGHLLVEDLGPVLEQVVDDPHDAALVARDHLGREHDSVALLDLEVLVFVRGHAGERAHGLALAAGGDHHDLIVREVPQGLDLEPRIRRHPEVAQVEGDLGVRDHALAVQDHLPAVHHRHVDDLLHAVDVRREGRHHDPSPGLAEDVLETSPHFLFREGVAALPGVRAVGKEREDAPVPVLREGPEVHDLAVHGRRIYLEVSRMHDPSLRGRDPEAAAVHDRVGHADELYLETTQLHHVQGPDAPKIGLLVQIVLPQFLPDEPERESRSVDRDLELLQKEGEGSDMVLVSVGQDHAADAGLVFDEVGEVGDHDVDAEHLCVGEHEARVDHHDVVAAFEHGHVEPDLAHAAQGDDGKGRGAGSRRYRSKGSVRHRVFAPEYEGNCSSPAYYILFGRSRQYRPGQ